MAGGDRKNADSALLTALASGRTAEEAARKAGVSPRTAFRRLDDPAFKAELNRIKQNILDRTTAQLSDAGLAAVATLRQLLKDGKGPIRLGAARSILEFADRYRAALDVETRLTALEEAKEGK